MSDRVGWIYRENETPVGEQNLFIVVASRDRIGPAWLIIDMRDDRNRVIEAEWRLDDPTFYTRMA